MEEYQQTSDLFTLPPNSVEAERSVLGAMLQDKSAVSFAIESLQKDDFFLVHNLT